MTSEVEKKFRIFLKFLELFGLSKYKRSKFCIVENILKLYGICFVQLFSWAVAYETVNNSFFANDIIMQNAHRFDRICVLLCNIGIYFDTILGAKNVWQTF